MKIQAVLFDCFGVLYIPVGEDFYRSHIPNYSEHKTELQDLGRQADYGFITQAELVEQIARIVGLSLDEVKDGIVGSLIRNQALLKFSQGLRPSHKVGLLTNMSSGSLSNYFTQEALKKYFDDVVVSSDVGMVKPNQGIYDLAAKNLNLDTSECLLVDDSLANCDGARGAGMQAVEYGSAEQAMNDIKQLLQ